MLEVINMYFLILILTTLLKVNTQSEKSLGGKNESTQLLFTVKAFVFSPSRGS